MLKNNSSGFVSQTGIHLLILKITVSRSDIKCDCRIIYFIPFYVMRIEQLSFECRKTQTKVMGPLQLAVTWYKIHHAGEQATHWDIQNKENANLS